jgi:hypothetical protein
METESNTLFRREQQAEEGSGSLEERKEKKCKWYYYIGVGPCH